MFERPRGLLQYFGVFQSQLLHLAMLQTWNCQLRQMGTIILFTAGNGGAVVSPFERLLINREAVSLSLYQVKDLFVRLVTRLSMKTLDFL